MKYQYRKSKASTRNNMNKTLNIQHQSLPMTLDDRWSPKIAFNTSELQDQDLP